MKRTLTILFLLLLAVVLALAWGRIDDAISRKIYVRTYESSVTRYAADYGVPESVVYAVIKTESNFTPDALSAQGAIGLMQITPETFEWLCSKTGEEPNTSLLYEPDTNIRYGTYFLSILYNEYELWDTVYAAYNAGRTRVNGWLRTEEYGNNGRLKDIPIPETAAYVEKVNKAVSRYEALYYQTDKTFLESILES